MAENSGFWTTNADPAGDQAASYSQADFSTAYRIMAACAGFEGVTIGYLNELACTANGANTVAVNTGGGTVDGKWFINDASQDVNIPSASGAGNTRIDRLVLRATWATFNVSVTRIAGTDAATPSAPAITQTSETTYDIKLCQVLVTTGGVVTVTDERTWAISKQIYRFSIFPATQYWSTGDGKYYHTVLEPKLEGATLSDIETSLKTPSTAGTPTIQVARGRRTTASGAPSYNDMLSTVATIDANEYTSLDAATAPVINSTYAGIKRGDILRFDVDVAGTGTQGAEVMLEFTL